MFHGVIRKITLAQFFLRHGVEVKSAWNVKWPDLFFLVDAWDDDVHLRVFYAVWNDAAAESNGMLYLYITSQHRHTALLVR